MPLNLRMRMIFDVRAGAGPFRAAVFEEGSYTLPEVFRRALLGIRGDGTFNFFIQLIGGVSGQKFFDCAHGLRTVEQKTVSTAHELPPSVPQVERCA